jgi:hypothetical protein
VNPCVIEATQNSTAVWDKHHKGVWHLNEEAAGTGAKSVYRDSTSNANHGDDQVSATEQEGRLAAGQAFDGVDDYVDCGANASLNITGQITISAWIRIRVRPPEGEYSMVMQKKFSAYQMFVHGNQNTATLGGYFLFRTKNNEHIVEDIRKGPVTDIVPGRWTHTAITYDGQKLRFYVNGNWTTSIRYHRASASTIPPITKLNGYAVQEVGAAVVSGVVHHGFGKPGGKYTFEVERGGGKKTIRLSVPSR